MDFGVSSVISACTLCYQIYNRCHASRGEFKSLSVQALSLHDILKVIENVVQEGNLNDQQLASLRNRIVPLLELLRTIDARLRKYQSLCTGSPKLADKINWAIAGGAAEIRNELNSQLQGLTAWNTSILLTKSSTTNTPTNYSTHPIKSTIESGVFELPAPLTEQELPKPEQRIANSEPYSIGLHSIGDGIQFVSFSILTLLAFAIILIIGCFYAIGLILFPLAGIPTCFSRSKQDWKRFNAFFSHMFNRIFRFTGGLWD